MDRKYHAVAVGKRPGLYNTFEDAQDQVLDVPGSQVATCDSLESAVEHMRNIGRVPYTDIRLYKRAFAKQGSFIPRQSNSFEQEFSLFASSQRLNGDQKSKARVDAIHEEVIFFYLPEGVNFSQMDSRTGHVRTTSKQVLLIYQAMCRQLGRPSHSTAQECIAEPKRRPYVNILDFVDVFRTGEEIRTFWDPHEFCEYTRRHPIRLKYAKESTFLAAFLQDLNQLSKLHRGYQDRGSRQELQGRMQHSLASPHSDRSAHDFIKSEIPQDAYMASLVGTYQFTLDLPPLSPQSDFGSSSSCYENGSSSPHQHGLSSSTSPSSLDSSTTSALVKPEATALQPAQMLDDDFNVFEDDKEIATQLSQQPSKEELDVPELEDIFQDDEELATQLSQQPSKEEPDELVLWDIIQDDEEISTQLTQASSAITKFPTAVTFILIVIYFFEVGCAHRGAAQNLIITPEEHTMPFAFSYTV